MYPDLISSKITWAGDRLLRSERGEDREKNSADGSGVQVGVGNMLEQESGGTPVKRGRISGTTDSKPSPGQ